MNKETENIITLLSSDDYQDKVLGIIMMEREGLTNDILDESDVNEDSLSRIRWFRSNYEDYEDRDVNVIMNKKLFAVWKGGIGIVRRRNFDELSGLELLYTDGSLDIQEAINEYNKWLENEPQ